MESETERINLVGPILEANPAGEAVVAAIRQLNPQANVLDRGSYLRVSVPGRCVVTRAAIEEHLGRSFQLPGDLEKVLSAFQGHFSVTEHEAVWEHKSAT